MSTDLSTAVYVRVSTDSQSTDSQVLAIQSFLEARGETVDESRWYIDEGVSGRTTVRPALSMLNMDIQRGRVTTLVLYDLSRLARNAFEGVKLLGEWLDMGLRVVIIAINLDLNQTVGRLIATVMLHVAELEMASLDRRRTDGIARSIHMADSIRDATARGADIQGLAAKHDLPVDRVQRIIDTRKGSTGWRVTGKGPQWQPKASPDAVRLRVIKGLSVRDIAKVLGCSTSTIALRIKDMGGVARIKQQVLDAANAM